MLKPEYLESVPDNLVELYAAVESDILADMARRISTYDYFIPAAQFQYKKLIELGGVHEDILKKLAGITGKSRAEIESLMREAGQKSLDFDDEVYKAAGLKTNVAVSAAVQSVFSAGVENTKGLFDNLTRTTANTATKQFENALDRAYMQISTGAFDYNTAIRNAVRDLAGRGIATIEYPTGKVDYMETAVRRAVLTGVNQTSLKMQLTKAGEMGSDLVETTAHAGARPDHVVWQGKVFSISGNHPKYPHFAESTGYGTGPGLGGWNCRHSFHPFFEGVSKPAYSKEELQAMGRKDYVYKGEKIDLYEANGKRRYMERQIRRWKREYTGMKAAGQPIEEAAANIGKWQKELKEFLEQNKFKRQAEWEQIGKYGHSSATSVSAAARRQIDENGKMWYNERSRQILEEIRSDQTLKTLNVGHQNKHILGSPGYAPGRSYILGDAQYAQDLVDQYHGTGEIRFSAKGNWVKKEFVTADHDIGMRVNHITGEETPTNTFAIHYGKKGTHMVPAKRRD